MIKDNYAVVRIPPPASAPPNELILLPPGSNVGYSKGKFRISANYRL